MPTTIVIPVSKDRPEDDILELVELFQKQLPDEILRVSDALIIECDNANMAAIFKQIAGQEIKTNNNGKSLKERKYQCIECGAPVMKAGNRCRSCGMKLVSKKNAVRLQAVRIAVENPADLEALKDIGL